MSIYSITNIPEMRSMFLFSRLSNDIAETLYRIETGQRILSAKDDPSGLIAREAMRTDIKGIQVAQKNTTKANELLATAESGLANISRLLIGDINSSDNGLIGLINDTTQPADMKKQQVYDILTLINGTIRTTEYNGNQLLNGSLGYRLAGVDTQKLSQVTVSRATPTSQGQAVMLSVLEQAKQGTLKIDSASINSAANSFDVRIEGTTGNTVDVHLAAGTYNTDDILAAINDQTSQTDIQADMEGTNIVLKTLKTGSDQYFEVIDSNNNLLMTEQDGSVSHSATGSDILVRINGQHVRGDGQQIHYYSDNLSLSTVVSQTLEAGDQTTFRITGGGSLFQLGRDVQEGMQYRMALPNMNTSHLGGASGTLENLRTIDLETDAGKAKATAIVNEAVNQVARERGRIGSVQKNVFDTNTINLDNQLERVSEAEGLISNTDIALESSRLHRLELLAQSTMDAILYSRNLDQWVYSLFS